MPPRQEQGARRCGWPLVGVCVAAMVLRVAAALALDAWLHAQGRPFLFGDSESYWDLATDLYAGRPYEVYGRPDFRTPGYPAVLAAAMSLAGASPLAVRLVQALAGAILPVLVYGLAGRWLDRGAALAAAALAAVDPYLVTTSVFILSESLFPILLVGVLTGLAGLSGRVRPWLAAGTGILTGAAVLTRPSFLLYVPLWGAAGLALGRHRRAVALNLLVVLLATAGMLVPWAVRNWRLSGRFVPLSSTLGVTLYDGLSPTATGASDQRFTLEPRWWGLDDHQRDRLWARLALEWAWAHPARALELAAVKLARFWSPWPNAEPFDAGWLRLAGAAAFGPMIALIVLGGWRWPGRSPGPGADRGRRPVLFLLGPLLYFMVLHMVFVSSIRYRVPALAPALVVAGVGLQWLVGRRSVAPERPAAESGDAPAGADASP